MGTVHAAHGVTGGRDGQVFHELRKLLSREKNIHAKVLAKHAHPVHPALRAHGRDVLIVRHS